MYTESLAFMPEDVVIIIIMKTETYRPGYWNYRYTKDLAQPHEIIICIER
jgi:hypothetical protein